MILKKFINNIRSLYNLRLNKIIKIVLDFIDVVTILCSISLLIFSVIKIGFRAEDISEGFTTSFYKLTSIIYYIFITAHIIFDLKKTRKHYRSIYWIISGLLYLILIPKIVNFNLGNKYIAIIVNALTNRTFNVILLNIFAILQISNNVVRLLGKRTNPSLILGGSFFIFIIIGTFILKMPLCTINGISWLDALFISTSSVCVTGLTPIDVSTSFTILGQSVILILIQVGGVGVMTLTTFFAMFFMGNTSLYSQLAVRDMLSSNSVSNSLWRAIIYILFFTMIIEAVGACVIFMNVHGSLGMSMKEEMFFAVFHSISAFCNAGFSSVYNGLTNPLLCNNHIGLYWTISILVILGGIGFPILVNINKSIIYFFKKTANKLLHRNKPVQHLSHIFNINTKIVLSFTCVLLVLGTIVVLLFEWDNTLAGMPFIKKMTHAFFTAACPRTAGFASIDHTLFKAPVLLTIVVLMWIGGAAQSAAGGIKVNSFATILLNLIAVIKGNKAVTIFNREISANSVKRASATMVMSFIIITLATFILSTTETETSTGSLLFEVVSALSTVGLSLNITPTLSSTGKIIICLLMFIGRVCFITFMAGIVRQEENPIKYPTEELTIN